jgi:OmpA-OmpF porin, OOP family
MRFRRILTGALIAGLLQLALIGSVAADTPKGPYIAVDGGMAWTANLTYTYGATGCVPPYYCYPSYYNAVTYNLGYSAGAQIGYAFGGPRVELEYNYRNNGANTIATSAGTQSATGTLTSNNFMVNVLYDFNSGSKWTPYVGLGLGAADVSANNIHPSGTVPNCPTGKCTSFLNGSGTDFAVQFILGTEYAVSDKIGVTIDWRGLYANNATFNYGAGCTSAQTGCLQSGAISYSYWNGALNLGLRIKF